MLDVNPLAFSMNRLLVRDGHVADLASHGEYRLYVLLHDNDSKENHSFSVKMD
jgi:hypothetical protein